MITSRRTVFFVSDSTAITAETLGHSLLTQFDHIIYEQVTLPFIDTPAKAGNVVNQINLEHSRTGLPPLVFSTLINREIRQTIMNSAGKCFDLFDTFIISLEKELSIESSQVIGRYHSGANSGSYDIRIDAVNYALGSDDGICTKNYDRADIILVGVSRAGKTPTCLYLGMQFGIFAANYPLTEEDLFGKSDELPHVLMPFRRKLYGLTINPDRLQKIRSQRRPESRYASLLQCQREVCAAESILQSERIPAINVTTMSVEEIAATVLHDNKLERRLW
ncbi:MAG: Phosphoenolpyruvate synthase regulatory protein [Syntrophus sp. SKADARSKE-3]|nr:Phosphoenolpyruvate synthase regulatory protein [Syntrophus sp. SKADARSKE-3]